MSGECDTCHEHCLDCTCNLSRCPECKEIIYRNDSTCMRCLLMETKNLLIKTQKHISELQNEKIEER
jgi:hypothetical protein